MGIFDDNQEVDQTSGNENSNAAPKEQVDLWVEKLVTITRPDGTPKYETVEDALDALKASQEHIARIENENKTLAEKAAEAETLHETIKRLSGNMNENEKPAPVTPQSDGGQNSQAAEELVKQILQRELAERDQVTTAVNNVKQVQDTLVKKYGEEKAREVIATKAKELGTTTEQLKHLSASNPRLVLELFGGASGSTSPNTSSVNLNGRPTPEPKLEAPEKSLISGTAATDRNRIDYLKKIREKVYKENGIT